MSRARVLTVAVLALCLSLAPPAVAAAGRSSGPLRKRLDRVVSRLASPHALWGIEVRSARTGRVLYARDESVSLTPASTLKLVTTAAALDALGPDATVETTLETTATLDERGVLQGDLYLVGRGDPLLLGRHAEQSVSAFDRLAEALVAAGVHEVAGRLVGWEGQFVGERRAADWAWSDLMWYYGADVSALTFHNDALHLRIAPGERAGDPVIIEAQPETSYYRVLSTASTSPPETTPALDIERPLGANVIHVRGTYPVGAEPENAFVSLDDPARYATTVLAETLAGRGVRVAGGVATASEPLPLNLRTLASHSSPPLSEILRQTNQPSHNLRAEILLRLLGLKARGEGSARAGLAAALELLTRQGVPTEGLDLRDGCGLAPTNLVTARALALLLVAMRHHAHADAFVASLPLAGREGTLRHRFQGTVLEGRLRAKTGYLSHTTTLAGYLPKRDDEWVVVILVNHDTQEPAVAQAAVDAFVLALAER